jgi:hypothetical protein
MTDQTKSRLSLLCWILIILALAVGFIIGGRYKQMSVSQPLGDCIRPDTVRVVERNVTLDRCEQACPDCLWIVRGR